MTSIKKIEKNREISNDIRNYFEENGLNIDEIFPGYVVPHDLADVKDLVLKLYSHDVQAKILLLTQLLETKKQLKNIQEFLAEISKNSERLFKELNCNLSKKE